MKKITKYTKSIKLIKLVNNQSHYVILKLLIDNNYVLCFIVYWMLLIIVTISNFTKK